ncbi:hypothetical protein B9Q17_02335 [Marinobacter vinifirmus]|uniref:Uncharacterized protein n=1 Tax=Marinobacter vinifirmus TaxID=355591 RepID=A0A7Z1DTL4_9GAMM|nr:hypothetical protein [Marinobacter vinifirmus]OZC35703.1 hypothetical protein B9Q17_02335 [Marinobacter vinifirmus]
MKSVFNSSRSKEHSFYWDAYLATMDTFIENRVKRLLPHELDALWLLTQEGDDWDTKLEEERETYPVATQDVVAYLRDELLTAANDWSNTRISGYLERGYG